MPLVAAKCTNCGANLKVNDAQDAAICEHCGCAFIVEKAINNYKIDHITVNVDKDTDLQSLRILAQESVLAGEYKTSAKLYYEIFTLDHRDILSKYFYQLSRQLVPMSEKEEYIWLKSDYNDPEHMAISRKQSDKDYEAYKLGMTLTDYCLQNAVLDHNDDNKKVAMVLIEAAYKNSSINQQMEPWHKLFAAYHETSAVVKEFSYSLAEGYLDRLASLCKSELSSGEIAKDSFAIRRCRDLLRSYIHQVNQLIKYYPELSLAEIFTKAGAWCSKPEISNVDPEAELRSKAFHDDSDSTGLTMLLCYVVVISFALFVLLMVIFH